MDEIQKALEAKFADVQNELKKLQESGADKAEVLKLHDAVKKQGQALTDYIEASNAAKVVSYQEQLTKFIRDNADELKTIARKRSGVLEFVPKVPETISTATGGDVETPPSNMNTSLGTWNFRDDNPLIALATVTNTNSPQYVYTEQVPKDGNYDFVAEGTAKPQIDWKWENRYVTPYKIAAYEVLTEEVVTDIARMESTAREYLAKKHDLFKADAIYFADGTAGKPEGATVVARAFVAGGMALKVATPNFMDVVNACVTDIYTTQNYVDETPYMANLVLINPVDFFLELVSAKDGNGLPLYPQAALFNQVTIGGMTIRPWSKIPAGKIFVADMSKYNVANYVPFSIRIGWINDQFITNMFTMLGESRFYAYVKNLDKQAFIYDDIATIKTAIAVV